MHLSASSQLPISISTRVIVDTNVVIELINHPQNAIGHIGSSAILCAPVIVLGELNFGAWKSKNVTANLARVQAFANSVHILLIDLDVALRFGQLQHELQAKGKPIPVNDLWIAATAITNNLALITRDSHFQHVNGLQIINW
jgi:tRNA(fMet)-specific endonuclease VapC